MSEWIETTVGEYCEFKYGKALPQNKRLGGHYSVYGSNGVVGTHNEFCVEKYGIIIGRKGSVGEVHLSLKPFWVIDTAFYVTKDSLDELKFTYFLLKTLGLDEMNSDSAVPGLNRNNAHSLKIRIPKDLKNREYLGRQLYFFNEKIQLNNETNQTLEAIAQAIFKHWFIDFAPVHAKAEALAEGKTAEQAELAAMASISGKTEAEITELAQTNPQAYQQLQQTAAAFPSEFVESELGLVPKGWEISTFKDYATFVKGKKPKNIYLKQEGELLPHILVSSLNGEYKEFANPENMTLVSSHETIMLMDGSGSGKISIGHDGIIGSTLAKLKLNDKKYWAFIYLFLSSKTDDIQNNTTGSAIPHTDKNRVYGYPISIPNDELLNLLNKLLDGIFSKIQVHTNENQTLAKTRDTLLPKLLSGEIEL